MENESNSKIEKMEKDIKKLKKRQPRKMTAMKFVGVAFDPEKYKAGEAEINEALSDGFEVLRDFETGGGNKRDLSVPIDWSNKSGEITAKLNFDQPLEFNSNIKLKKLHVVLKELDIPVGKRFDVNRFYKKLNPKVIVFPKL